MQNANFQLPKWVTPVPDELVVSGEGELVIEFAEKFGIITKDSVAGRAGESLVLREWQKFLVRRVFAGSTGGRFAHRVSLLGLPRKSGKSALGSVLALYGLMFGPKGGEVYSVAAEKEQARIVFADAKRIIEASPALSAVTKLYRDAIEYPAGSSVYRVLSAESYSKEGLNPSLILFDELHAQKNRELFDVMSLAMGARGDLASLIAITTAGVKTDTTGRDSIAYSLYQYGQKIARGEIDDPSFFMAWWESEGDHRLEETWREANPGFGDLSDPADFESAVRRTPEAEFRTKRCNQWVSSQLSWLPSGAWDACESDFEISQDDEIVLGFDGSFSKDATVIVGATIPKDEDDPVRVFLVKAWEKDLAADDDTWRVDISEVEDTIIDFCQRFPLVKEIVCDVTFWSHTLAVLEERGLPIVQFPQAPSRMIPACATFYEYVLEKRLQHDGDALLARHIDNAVVKMSPAGPHIKKENPNSPRKIDAAVALVMAVSRATAGRIEMPIPQFYF